MFIDSNLTAAADAMAQVEQAASKISGVHNRSGAAITNALVPMDWDESEIQAALLHVDSPASAAGAGAAANVDACIESVESALTIARTGWTGAAAAKCFAFGGVVKSNLLNFKEELEGWAKDIAADGVEQATSATREVADVTANIARRAKQLETSTEDAAQQVLRASESEEHDPGYQQAARQVIGARDEFLSYVDQQVDYIGKYPLTLLLRHAQPTVVIADPSAATPVISYGFSADLDLMEKATHEALEAVAMMRDAGNNLEAAYNSTLQFGTTAPGIKMNALWTSAAELRLDDHDRLFKQVQRLAFGIDDLMRVYRKNELQTTEELERVISEKFEDEALSENPAKSLPADNIYYTETDTNKDIADVINSDWEGAGKIPDVVPRNVIIDDELQGRPPEVAGGGGDDEDE